MKINILSIETSRTNNCEFVIDKPKGVQNYTLYILKTQTLSKTTTGLADMSPGDCLLLGPGIPHYFRGKNGNWTYDSISFKGPDATRLVTQSGIELNSQIRPQQSYFFDSLLEKISVEIKTKDLSWEKIVALSLHELLIKINRFARQDFVLSMPDHSQKLRDLRTEVHENFSKPWTIGQMAAKMGLSSSRFASLYKQEFSTSPTEDLIKTRIDQARKMLSETKVSIKQVSLACGFESVHYFHRAFKRRNNITPKHYQNQKLSMKGSVPQEERIFTLDQLSLDSDFSGTMQIVDGEFFLNGSNSDWSEFLGYTTEDMKNMPFIDYVSPSDLTFAHEMLGNVSEGMNIINISINLLDKNKNSRNIVFSVITTRNSLFWFAKKSLVEI